MNRTEYAQVLNEIMQEIQEPKGTFLGTFGSKTPEELEEIRMIAGIALYATDRFYSKLTKIEFDTQDGRSVKSTSKSAEYAN